MSLKLHTRAYYKKRKEKRSFDKRKFSTMSSTQYQRAHWFINSHRPHLSYPLISWFFFCLSNYLVQISPRRRQEKKTWNYFERKMWLYYICDGMRTCVYFSDNSYFALPTKSRCRWWDDIYIICPSGQWSRKLLN